MKKTEEFYKSLELLAPTLRKSLEFISDEIKSEVQEIRIRINKPLCLTLKGKSLFVLKDGSISQKYSEDTVVCTKNQVEESFSILTNNSVYAHLEEIKQGFVKTKTGNRVGLCGTFSDNMIFDVSGINIRIAREIKGCAKEIFNGYYGGGILILGPPGSGKTTVLRDFVRLLSNSGKRVCVIDSRGEISALRYGISSFDLGVNTDVYNIEDKAKGMEMALRTMFPNIIALDEVGNSREITEISESFNSGVDVVLTAHIGVFEEWKDRKVVSEILGTGAIEQIAILPTVIGEKIIILHKGEWKQENDLF